MRPATGLLAAVAIALATPAKADGRTGQARAQVERGLERLGVAVPGGVAALSDRQVLELLAEINLRERDSGRIHRIRQIIARTE